MTFTFKLSKRLAQSWTTRAVLVVATFLHMPFETTVTLVILSSFLSVRVWRSEIGDRRRCRDGRRYPSGQSARLWDQYPCRELFVLGVVVQLGCLAVPKVGP